MTIHPNDCGNCKHWHPKPPAEQETGLLIGDCDKIPIGKELTPTPDGEIFTYDGWSFEDECYDEEWHCFEGKPPWLEYEPCAVTKDGQQLFTYDSVLTIGAALEQFKIWDDQYDIAEAWIIERNRGKNTVRIPVERKWDVGGEALEEKK